MKRYISGANGILEAMKNGRGLLYVSRNKGRSAELAAAAKRYRITLCRVSDKDISAKLSHGEHRGYLLEIQTKDSETVISQLSDLWEAQSESSMVILLDGISDPQNLGAVLRSSDQFSADAVIIPARRSAGRDADTLSRSSAGAVEWVPLIEVSNINHSIRELKDHGYWVWGADMAGERVDRVDLKGRNAIVLGREGQGLHRLVRENCDALIRIPTSGRIDSLNVATAAGILMYEVRRRQS